MNTIIIVRTNRKIKKNNEIDSKNGTIIPPYEFIILISKEKTHSIPNQKELDVFLLFLFSNNV